MLNNSVKKKLTIKEIAKLANTSKTTVSFYLNKKFECMSVDTRNRIKKVIKENNYVPNVAARNLSNSKTNLIGVIISDITNTFSNKLVKGIEDCANKNGYQIIIGSSNYDYELEKKHVERLLQIGVDAFIVQPTSQFSPLIDTIKSMGKELIFIDSNLDNDEVMSVKSDNYNSVYNCIQNIIEKKNYNNFIIIGGDPKDLSTRQERANGFIDALVDNDLNYTNIIVSNNAKEDEIKEKLLPLIKLSENNLVFVPNCWLLPMVFLVLSVHSTLIPNVIGILGFDNLEWCKFVSPQITTIVQPAYEEGNLVASKIINLIEGGCVGEKKETMMCDVSWQGSVLLD